MTEEVDVAVETNRHRARPEARSRCPSDAALVRMAELPTEQDTPISDHLTGCSPCFKRYMEILAELKRKSC